MNITFENWVRLLATSSLWILYASIILLRARDGSRHPSTPIHDSFIPTKVTVSMACYRTLIAFYHIETLRSPKGFLALIKVIATLVKKWYNVTFTYIYQNLNYLRAGTTTHLYTDWSALQSYSHFIYYNFTYPRLCYYLQHACVAISILVRTNSFLLLVYSI